MFDLWKKNRQLKIKETELAIKERDVILQTLDQALEARNDVVDDDIKQGFQLLGDMNQEISEESHTNMLTAAYRLYHTNPHARAIIRSLVKFTFGKGPTIVPDEEKKAKEVKEIWQDFRRENKFNKREKEVGTRTFRDGEMFLRLFVNKYTGDTKVRFIRAHNIGFPKGKMPHSFIRKESIWSYGIKCKLDDIETPVQYCLIDNEGNFRKYIPAEEIIHEKILCDADQKRGVSILRVSAKRIRQYDEWLEDRIVLNKVRSAIALVRKVDGSTATTKKIRDEQLSNRYSSDKNRTSMFRRGTILTASKGIEYDMLSPKIQASDVVEDGRAMLLAVAAASGLPEMIFTADYSNANYSSTLIAQNPFVREIEDWQDFFSGFYEDLFAKVIQAKIGAGKLPVNTKTTCRCDFPPMIQADLDKLAKAFEILFKYKIVSKKTWRGRMGLDDDIEKAEIENEEGDEVYPLLPGQPGIPGGPPGQGKSPFNMPMSPVNQFGHELLEAIKEKDWDKMSELVDKIEELEKELENAD